MTIIILNKCRSNFIRLQANIRRRQKCLSNSIDNHHIHHDGERRISTGIINFHRYHHSSIINHMINKNLNDHSYAKRDYHHHHHVVDQQCQIRGRLYRWNEVLFSSTFNEIVRLDSAIVDDITQYSLFREKNFIKSFDKGFFSLMPFVVRSLERLNDLVNQHMYQLGAQKVQMPSIVGKHLWLRSERWQLSGQEIFRVKDRHQMEYCLAPTHEEVVTQILASCNQLSHRQLPIYLYQISPKYRDELRTKFGLLRAREFIMKDLYTFDKDEDTAKQTYQMVSSMYENLFRLLELPVIKTVGSVGTIGGKHSHEFLLATNLGEDEMYTCLDCSESFNAELLADMDDQQQPHCLNCKSHNLTSKQRALELGHSFLLSDRYSSRMGAIYLAEHSNKQIALQMGCYGLGISRILAASVEYLSCKYQQSLSSDSDSSSTNSLSSQSTSTLYDSASNSLFLRWPKLIVPFKVCLILPKRDSKEDHGKGTEFSMHLANVIRNRFGEDILIDDRSNLTIGKRLLTAKTIGIPFILVAGRNIIDVRPKFEMFDMYIEDDNVNNPVNAKQGRLMTQAEILDYLKIHLKHFRLNQE
ncbi:prolyl-tRNA synthetase 2-like protein, mitochondrial [Dermatophagoides farinae]|uniref:proline--tRNA ligase n=2 Tax=Dermatophagoides farinae TaxID=6954 RepID=A0A922I6N8_DERFA|nr:probable proline--tRNA ligase, mitochondrial [Dermatophagoides farinae]KAH9522268.1 prolyl-tRNA synthetase [Dermatophagoides farinae]